MRPRHEGSTGWNVRKQAALRTAVCHTTSLSDYDKHELCYELSNMLVCYADLSTPLYIVSRCLSTNRRDSYLDQIVSHLCFLDKGTGVSRVL